MSQCLAIRRSQSEYPEQVLHWSLGSANMASLVQFWWRLPTIYEGLMGDTPTGRPVIDGDVQNTGTASSAQRSSTSPFDESEGPNAFHGGPHAPGSQGNYPPGPPFPFQQHASQSRQGQFDMASLGTALPDVSYMNYGNASPQRFPSGPSPSAHLYQLPNMPWPPQLDPTSSGSEWLVRMR